MLAIGHGRLFGQASGYERLAFVFAEMELATRYLGAARNANDSHTRQGSLASAWRSLDAITDALASGVACSASQAAVLDEVLAGLWNGVVRLDGPLECPRRSPGLAGFAAAVGALVGLGAIAGGVLTLVVAIVRAAL
jgi:hypothetical protein